MAWAFALAGMGLGADSAPAQSPPGLEAPETAARVTISGLDDPRVKACLALALPNQDPNIDPLSSAVENGAAIFSFQVVHEGVAACRTALAAFPTERKVVVADYLAAETLSWVLFGRSLPTSDEAAFGRALLLAVGENTMLSRSASFFVASAFEHGVGTKADRGEAIRWYRRAADGGDAVSRRQQTRLESSGSPAK